MSLSDVLAVMAIFIALAGTYLTLYFQYFRPANLQLFCSNVFEAGYANNRALHLQTNMILIHQGAKPCIVNGIECELTNGSTKEVLDWAGFYESSFPANRGK